MWANQSFTGTQDHCYAENGISTLNLQNHGILLRQAALRNGVRGNCFARTAVHRRPLPGSERLPSRGFGNGSVVFGVNCGFEIRSAQLWGSLDTHVLRKQADGIRLSAYDWSQDTAAPDKNAEVKHKVCHSRSRPLVARAISHVGCGRQFDAETPPHHDGRRRTSMARLLVGGLDGQLRTSLLCRSQPYPSRSVRLPQYCGRSRTPDSLAWTAASAQTEEIPNLSVSVKKYLP